MGIILVDEAIAPDVQWYEYETDDSDEEDHNLPDELPVNGKQRGHITICLVELSEQLRS